MSHWVGYVLYTMFALLDEVLVLIWKQELLEINGCRTDHGVVKEMDIVEGIRNEYKFFLCIARLLFLLIV